MRLYKENDSVIYTDSEGNRIDTFVIFDTDRQTGLTHINHLNLKVREADLELHTRSANGYAIPMSDPASFELFRQLKQKYVKLDNQKKKEITLYPEQAMKLLPKAS
ncbi:MAG TPA: hypothetical protein VHA52_00350 [Candidatus Babeliaceae bacterium]|nr:hypothetical protein [Candidatus Babeliaceae bacterium]